MASASPLESVDETSAVDFPATSRADLPGRELFRCVERRRVRVRRSVVSTRVLTRALLAPRPSRSLAGHQVRVVSIAAHPVLPVVVSGAGDDRGADHVVRVWDLESRSALATLVGHHGFIFGLAIDPSGRYVASGAEDRTVRVWELASGRCLHTLVGHPNGVFAVTWDPTSSLIASGASDHEVRLWDAATGALRVIHRDHASHIYALASHPTENLFASGSDDATVRVRRWPTGETLRVLRGHSRAVSSLAVSASFLVSASFTNSVRVWSWTSDACLRVIDGFSKGPWHNSLAWRGPTLAILDGDGTVGVWDASASDPTRWERLGSLPAKAASSNGIAVLEHGRVACGEAGDMRKISVWGK